MTHEEVFAARLDRLHSEANATIRRTPKPPIDDGPMSKPPKKPFELRQMFLPAVSLVVLFVGALALSTALSSSPASPFDLKSAIISNMSDEKRESLGKDPQIEQELKKRNFSDPDLARLILSN